MQYAGTGEQYLRGARARIVIEIGPQTGRKKEQAPISDMEKVLHDGCLDALVKLREAAHFVKKIEIMFPASDGDVFVWPSVSLVLCEPEKNGKGSRVFYDSGMKFESCVDTSYIGGAVYTLSKDAVSERIVKTVIVKIKEYTEFLKEVAKEIERASDV